MSKVAHLDNPAVQGRLRTQMKDREQRIATAIDTIMSHPEGRFALHYIVYTLLGLESVCTDPTPRMADLWEGRRWGAKMIKELIEQVSAKNLPLMLTEAVTTAQRDSETQSAAKTVTDEDNDADS